MADNVSEILRRAKDRGNDPPPSPHPAPLDENEVEEYLAYGKLRGPRQVSFMLELRAANGNSDSLDYGWLIRARLDPSRGIVLHFGGVTVKIWGRALRPLYEAIKDHRVVWVQELTNPPTEAVRNPDETLVTRIEIDPA